MARNSSSETLLWLYVDQSRSVTAGAARPTSVTNRVMVCRLAILALPPRRPKETNPSAHGQISRLRPTDAPVLRPRSPARAKRGTAAMFATITASCIDTSTRCGRPLASAVNAATATSGPTWAYPDGSVQRTGARSGSPVANMLPLAAITPRSDARQPALGPSDPNGVTTTHTESGASCGSASMVPGQPGVVSTMSAPARIDA